MSVYLWNRDLELFFANVMHGSWTARRFFEHILFRSLTTNNGVKYRKKIFLNQKSIKSIWTTLANFQEKKYELFVDIVQGGLLKIRLSVLSHTQKIKVTHTPPTKKGYIYIYGFLIFSFSTFSVFGVQYQDRKSFKELLMNEKSTSLLTNGGLPNRELASRDDS